MSFSNSDGCQSSLQIDRGHGVREPPILSGVEVMRSAAVACGDELRPSCRTCEQNFSEEMHKYGLLERHRRKSGNNLHLDSPGLNDRSILRYWTTPKEERKSGDRAPETISTAAVSIRKSTAPKRC